MTLEAMAPVSIYPVLYARTGGRHHRAHPGARPLLRYDGADARRVITEVVTSVLG